MKSLIKFLVLALIIVFAGLWIMTVYKSCDKDKTTSGMTEMGTDLRDKVTEVTDDAESLFEGETEEEGLFDEDGEELTTNGKNGANDEDDMDEYEDEEDPTATDLAKEIEARKGNSSSSSSTNSSAGSSSGMEYLVIGGAFLTEANAKAEVRRLKKNGYNNAEVITFDFSQYYSVCVQRTASLSAARSSKNKLVKEGNAEAYVHKKRSYKK